MQQVIVDCANGQTTVVALTPAEEAERGASAQATAAAEQAQVQAAAQAAEARAGAVQTILSAPAITADPALQAALACLLGAQRVG